MDLEYFELTIKEELEGASDYILKAIELRAMVPAWSKTLVEMSLEELQHATHLYKMFEEYYSNIAKPYKEIPDYIEEGKDRIINCFSKKYSKIKLMHEAYNK